MDIWINSTSEIGAPVRVHKFFLLINRGGAFLKYGVLISESIMSKLKNARCSYTVMVTHNIHEQSVQLLSLLTFTDKCRKVHQSCIGQLQWCCVVVVVVVAAATPISGQLSWIWNILRCVAVKQECTGARRVCYHDQAWTQADSSTTFVQIAILWRKMKMLFF